MATPTPRPDAPRRPEPPCGLRWRRVFPGHGRELAALRRWLSTLLPACPARDDVLVVATELGSNAIEHTASGQDGCFAVEITWHGSVVQVAVADYGGPAEPQLIEDHAAERGRGLQLVNGLSVRTGVAGDQRGRLMWAQIAFDSPAGDAHPAPPDPYLAVVGEGQAALARRFAGVPAWFGHSTLQWWALAGPGELVSAPTAAELAGLLYRVLNAPDAARLRAAQAHRGAGGLPAAPPRRRAAGGQSARRNRPGTASAGIHHPRGHGGGRPAGAGHPARAPGLAATGAVWPAGA